MPVKDTISPTPSHDFTQTDRLTDLIDQSAELWHSPDGRTFATVFVSVARRSFPIESSEFAQWLRREYYNRQGRAPTASAISDATAQADPKDRLPGP